MKMSSAEFSQEEVNIKAQSQQQLTTFYKYFFYFSIAAWEIKTHIVECCPVSTAAVTSTLISFVNFNIKIRV